MFEFSDLAAGQDGEGEARDGFIATVPDADDRVEVVTPGFADDLRLGPCPYMPRPERDPMRGDRCLVVLSSERRPWVVAWYPK